VAEAARRAGMPDADAIIGTLAGLVAAERGTETEFEQGVQVLLASARRQPGHLFEATAARIVAMRGRTTEADAELDRLLPRALAASGPRWLGAMADLSVVAAEVANADASARLAEFFFEDRRARFRPASAWTRSHETSNPPCSSARTESSASSSESSTNNNRTGVLSIGPRLRQG